MAKKGKHSKPVTDAAFDADEIEFAVGGDYSPTANSVEDTMEKAAKRRRSRKIAVIVVTSVVGAIAAVYLVGVIAFTMLFFPGTTIGDNDISLQSASDVEALLDEAASSYAFTVEGQGVSLAMTSSEAGISYDTDAVIASMRERVSAWAWPYEVFQTRDMADCVVVRYATTALEDELRAACATINETAVAPVNATIGYDAAVGEMVVVAEQYGTMIDADEVVAYVQVENNALNERIVLPDEVLVEAEIRQDDERLAHAAETANAYLTTDVDLLIAGQVAASVNPESMATWIVMDENFQVTLDEALESEWVKQVAASCSTVGAERTYTRYDGKQVTVSGGDYGWKVDEEALVKLVDEAVLAGQQGEVDMPLSQEGSVFNGVGAVDWGNRYLDIDLSEQHAYLYGDDGSILWESDIVSGGPGASRATPTGVWDVNQVAGYTMLVGRNSDGSIDYETPVNYWMPFVRNSIGLHDANWRGSFGGNIYTYNGSHGCVNLPVSKAKELHDILKVGDVVITHW